MLRGVVRSGWMPVFAVLAACGGGEDDGAVAPAGPTVPGGWAPGVVPASLTEGPRGLRDVRGLIHSHSVYSHDACDYAPMDPATHAIDSVCFEDFRRGLCQARHDFVMLTDHRESFSATAFPETLLYRAERGDALVERGGGPVASWAACPAEAGGGRALVLAGNEAGMMPVGLERHVSASEPERDALYGQATPEAVATLRAHGAVVLLAHTEGWTPEEILALGVDGFEMFNLHANAVGGAGAALELLARLVDAPETLPHPDLTILPIVHEDPVYLDHWATVLARGARAVTTIGTDCHRNSFPDLLSDGERIDSYRRMMVWMSNHLLLRPEPDGSWDDRHLKDALRGGRLYGAFEVLGHPEGFDFFAHEGGSVREMGEILSLASGVELVVRMPRVRDLGAALPAPGLVMRLLVADEGGWRVAAETDAPELRHAPSERGAYRAEVRMRPRHLGRWLAAYDALADADFVWIYSNAIYVAP
jgi:hypothetical protein